MYKSEVSSQLLTLSPTELAYLGPQMLVCRRRSLESRFMTQSDISEWPGLTETATDYSV
jgi:hypothetical protein